jgi:1,2-diacylglycerol-3-alpha-glucose alpha-1,2-galactosyltransferase
MMRDADFVWVGGFLFGSLSAERRRLEWIIESAPPNVTFTGLIPRPSVLEYYAAADIFFSPSFHETFGLAILEAAAAGIPIVLRDLSCYRELFCGAYIPVTDDDFGGALRGLVQDERIRLELGARAKETARRFDTRAQVHKLVAAYVEAAEAARYRVGRFS